MLRSYDSRCLINLFSSFVVVTQAVRWGGEINVVCNSLEILSRLLRGMLVEQPLARFLCLSSSSLSSKPSGVLPRRVEWWGPNCGQFCSIVIMSTELLKSVFSFVFLLVCVKYNSLSCINICVCFATPPQ